MLLRILEVLSECEGAPSQSLPTLRDVPALSRVTLARMTERLGLTERIPKAELQYAPTADVTANMTRDDFDAIMDVQPMETLESLDGPDHIQPASAPISIEGSYWLSVAVNGALLATIGLMVSVFSTYS